MWCNGTGAGERVGDKERWWGGGICVGVERG